MLTACNTTLVPVKLNHSEREDGDFDAAEIDRELIASRLQQDVVSLLLANLAAHSLPE